MGDGQFFHAYHIIYKTLGSEVLGRAVRVEVPGCCPLGRPRKTCRQCVMGSGRLDIEEDEAVDRVVRASSSV